MEESDERNKLRECGKCDEEERYEKDERDKVRECGKCEEEERYG